MVSWVSEVTLWIKPSRASASAKRRTSPPKRPTSEPAVIDVRIPSFDELSQHPGIAVEGRAALGVGDQHPVTLALQVEYERVEAGDRRGERRLHQQPGPSAEAQARELLGSDVDQPRHRELGAGQDLELDLLGVQARIQPVHELGDRVGVVGVGPADVGRGHERARARGHGGASERDRVLDRLGAVVDAGQHVRVQVDH